MLRGRATVTEHVYDDTGRLVRTVTASPWTPEDRALMLARQRHIESLCPDCHQPRDRAWHPKTDGWWQVALVTCHACAAKSKAAKRSGGDQRFALFDTYDDSDGPITGLPELKPVDPDDIVDETPKGGALHG